MNYFHILNRGVEKRKIFQDKEDHLRFIFNLYDFNNNGYSDLPFQRRRLEENQKLPKDDILTEILCWCAMPNHFHIFGYEKKDKGISLFSKKVTSGYTQYFNLKNKRKGVLFQGRTKIIPVSKDKHFLYLPYYILSNPIKLIQPNWQKVGIKNIDKTLKFLKEYQWSSLYEITNDTDLYSKITDRQHLFSIFGAKNKEGFIKGFESWLSVMR